MADYQDITYEVEDGIATVVIDRPDAYNAFTENTIQEINDALRCVRDNERVYSLLLTGKAPAFCAGADITRMGGWEDQTKEAYRHHLSDVQNVIRQLRNMTTPSIAAVNGPAIGAGCDFALACDMRVAGMDALFREGFVQVGLVPGDGGAWLLPKLIGEAKAREYLLTGKDIDAETAADLGLVVRVDDDPIEAAHDLAHSLHSLPRIAVTRTNALINEASDFEEHCERAIEYQWECVNDPEREEAVAAFREDREPEYNRNTN